MPQMLDFRDRFRVRKIFYSKAVAMLLLVALVIILEATWGMYEKSREASDRRDKTLSTQAQYQEREKELDEDIGRLSTDRGIEEEIRTRYMVAKDGENVIIVRTPEEDKEKNTIIIPEKETSFVQKMFGAIGVSGE